MEIVSKKELKVIVDKLHILNEESARLISEFSKYLETEDELTNDEQDLIFGKILRVTAMIQQ